MERQMPLPYIEMVWRERHTLFLECDGTVNRSDNTWWLWYERGNIPLSSHLGFYCCFVNVFSLEYKSWLVYLGYEDNKCRTSRILGLFPPSAITFLKSIRWVWHHICKVIPERCSKIPCHSGADQRPKEGPAGESKESGANTQTVLFF